jgi:site-specific DNA-methyltransferase (adenine-specific)
MLQWLDGGIDMSKDNDFIVIADMLADKYQNFRSGNTLLLNADCMDVMALLPDGFADLAIVDPPYGIGEDGSRNASRGKLAIAKDYKPYIGNDKEPPTIEYFVDLRRLSKNQIIWGANHFITRIAADSSCWIVWDKITGESDFADSELAFTSLKTAVRNFRFQWSGMLQGNMKNKEFRIHPNQKPRALYDWLLTKYAEPEHIIFDSHGGSFSSAIASHYFGTRFIGVEKDADYFNEAVNRFKYSTSQVDLLQEFA